MSNILRLTDKELQEICVIFSARLLEVKNPDLADSIESTLAKASEAFMKTELYSKIREKCTEVTIN